MAEVIKDTIWGVMEALTAQKKRGPRQDPEVWLKKCLTRKEFGHIKFHYLRKGILGIKVDSAVWLYALNLHKADLLTKLRAKSGEIKDIRFSLGETDG